MRKNLILLEEELKKLEPLRLSNKLQNEITNHISNKETSQRKTTGVIKGLVKNTFLLKIAASIIITACVIFIWTKNQTIEMNATNMLCATTDINEKQTFEPVNINTFLVAQNDEGIIHSANHVPMRKMSYNLIDNVQWETPEHKTFISKNSRKEIVLVDLSLD